MALHLHGWKAATSHDNLILLDERLVVSYKRPQKHPTMVLHVLNPALWEFNDITTTMAIRALHHITSWDPSQNVAKRSPPLDDRRRGVLAAVRWAGRAGVAGGGGDLARARDAW